ncbi:MAG: hypothetical protein ABEH88_10945 [Halobacteriales archaeon]
MTPKEPPTREKRAARHDERGQTNLDLLVGVSVFLVVAGVVLAAASGMADPFVTSQASPVAADRTTELITEGMFVPADASGSLDATCAFGFFNESMGTGTCAIAYDESEPDLAARLGLPSRYTVNVTIRRDVTGDPAPEVLCTDGRSVDACPGSTRLAAGPPPPDSKSTVSSRRGAALDGMDVIVEVVLW